MARKNTTSTDTANDTPDWTELGAPHDQRYGLVDAIANPQENLFIDPTAEGGYARAIRSQADNLAEYWSNATISHNDEPSMTKPEMGQESDINDIMARYGATAQRPVKYGDTIDYSMDLTLAHEALREVKDINTQVPKELRYKYPTWREVLNAAESGEYEHDLQELAAKKLKEEQAKKETEKTSESVT